jgi:DNA polymerase III alpha subunit
MLYPRMGARFITIEDETGVANLVIWPKILEQNRRTILGSGMLRVAGRIQWREGSSI